MNHQEIRDVLIAIGDQVCQKVHQSIKEQSVEDLSAVYTESDADTIYQIDRDVEEIIVPLIQKEAERLGGVVLVAEGIGAGEKMIFPDNWREAGCSVRIIMDPIDGTRGIMYDKRSAFFLAGAAPNHGENTRLKDIEVAVMTELPTSRSNLSDILFAIRGKGYEAVTHHLETGGKTPRKFRPSRAHSILGGFGQIARFFPPGRSILAAIEDELIETLYPDAPEGKAVIFEDQYISSGGQLHELLAGHDRFIADIRTALYAQLKKTGKKIGHVCHPYDLCAVLIGQEAGLIITDIQGNSLDAPLNTTEAVDWIGYANENIRQEVEPVLQKILKKYDLI